MSTTPIQELESQLQKLVDSSGTLTLAPDAISSAAIETLFANYLQDKPLVVTAAQVGIPQGLNFVQVFGTAAASSEPFGLMSIDARFTFTSDAYQLTLFASFGTDKTWWLAQGFAALNDPDDPIGFLPIAAAAFSLSSSGEFSAPTGLAFTGNLQFNTQQTGFLSAIFPTDTPIQGPVNSVDSKGVPDLLFEGTGPLFSFAGIFSAQPIVSLARQTETLRDDLLNGLYAGASFAYGSGSTSLPVYMLPPFNQQYLTVGSLPSQTAKLSFSNITQLAGDGNYSPMLPTAITLPGDLTLKAWQMQLNVDFSGKVSLNSLSVTVGTGLSFRWPITDKIIFTSLEFTFRILQTGSLGFGVQGVFLLDKETDTTLEVYAAYPGFAFGGAVSTPGIELKRLVALFSDSAADAVSEGLQLTALSFRIDPGSSIYHFDTSVAASDKPWQITIGDTPAFSLLNASLTVDSVASDISFACEAQLQLGSGSGDLPLLTLGATYTTADGWTFLAKIETFTFPQLVTAATGYFPDPLVKALEAATPNIAINLMSVQFSPSGPNANFQFQCDATWTLDLGGTSPLIFGALVDLTRTPGAADNQPALMAGAGIVTGTISGTVQYEDTFELTVVLTLLPGDGQNYAIDLIWGALKARYDSATKTVKFTFGNITLGEMVEKMVNTVVPGQNFTLTPPWDLLNSISLAGVSVTLDFAKKTLALSYDLGFSLAFVSIQQITLIADFSGAKSTVMFTISKGSVLGIPVSQQPVGWNVLEPGSAKQVPGFGSGVLQVDFLAFGQRFEPVKALDTSSLRAALTDVKKAFATKPTDPNPGLRYNAATNWIIGLDCSILDGSLSLGILFLDPLLYGVTIAVASKGKLGALGGLSIDILYKKVNDTLGVYQAILTLPDIIRTINIGSVSITLPVISVWIYTNGNFKVDFGFPKGMDFSQSAALQILPFLGFGGFYFAVLDSSTATNLPKTIKGTFSPVISFGIGLQVGVGKTVSFGVISGGAYITLVAIIEGTFATWNPFPNYPQQNATYWAITGQAALVGRVYGVANFVVVVARFDITITLSVQLRMAAYTATSFTFTASVSVSASISINLGLFSITIGFSFKMTYSAQFIIGTTTSGPWDASGKTLAWTQPRVGESLNLSDCIRVVLKWTPVTAEEDLRLWLLPNVTTGSAVDGITVKPAVGQVVVTLAIERDVPEIEPIETPSPFTVLAEGVLLWALNAGLNGVETSRATLLGQTITYDTANNVMSALTGNSPAAPFTLQEVTNLLTKYFRIVIEQRSTGAQDNPSVSAFPISPAMILQVLEQTPIPFNATGMTDAETLQEIRKQFYQMQPEASDPPQITDNVQASLATFLFLDYFMVIAKGTVQAALEVLKNAKSEFSATDTLRDWAKHGTRGANATLEEFAALNHTVRLAEGKRLALPAAGKNAASTTVAVASGETLLGLARRYGTTVDELVRQNADVPGLFAGQAVRTSIDDGMVISDLLKAMEKNNDFDNLAGQSVRVLLQGLRLPWPAVGDPGLPLYAITGQQFDASTLKANDYFTLSVAADSGFAFSDGTTQGLSTKFVLDPAMVTVIGQMKNAVLDIPFSSAIQPFYDTVAKRFTLTAPSQWSSSSTSGSLARAAVGEVFSSWLFPPDLMSILAAKPELLPLVELDEETRDADFLMPYSTKGAVDAISHAWSTIFQVTIAPVPSTTDPSQPLVGVYNLSGTDAVGGALLEALIVSNSTTAVPIAQLYILRGQQAGSNAGLVFDPVDATSFFVLQTNLSTASNPPGAVATNQSLQTPAQGTIGMTPLEMLTLIWECSVVRSGGYQLYYNYKDAGLPSALFAQNGSAQLTFAVTYGYTDDRLRPFMNSVVVTQAVDSKSELFVQAINDPQTIEAGGRTLRELARVARMTVAELAERNADVLLNAGTALLHPLKAGQFASNEAPLVLDQPQSLGSIAAQLGCSVHALARANRDRALVFAAPLSIDPILLTRSNAFPAGNVGFSAQRNFAQNPMWLRSSGHAHTQAMADALVTQQFQLMTYNISPNLGFGTSPEGVPLSAEEDAEKNNTYHAVVPVSRFALDQGPLNPPAGAPPSLEDPYRGVGKTVDLTLNWHDIYGNLIPHTAGSAYSLSSEILYTDSLIAVSQWPGVGIQYRIEATPPEIVPPEALLYVDVSTDANRYVGDSGPEVAETAAKRFAAIYYQLARNATVVLGTSLDAAAVPTDVTAPLVAFVVASYIYTKAISEGKTPGPAPSAVLAAPVKDTSSEALFSLTTTLTIARTPSLVEPSMDDPLVGTAGIAASNVAAAFQNTKADEPTSLTIFAQNLQACFPTLMVAVGTPDSTAGAEEVWLMRFGAGGYNCKFDPAKVQYVSLKPLSLNPFSAPGIPIQTYTVDTPLPNQNIVAKTFSNIDLDLVASNFLAAMDQFLSPEYGVNAWRIATAGDDPPSPNPVNQILNAKKELARRISTRLAGPFLDAAVDDEMRKASRDKLEQELLVRLSAAYQIDSVVALNATVSGPKSDAAPQFYGSVSAKKSTTATNATESPYTFSTALVGFDDTAKSRILTFTFATANKAAASIVNIGAQFDISHLMYDPHAMPTPLDKYTASSWLSFVTPFALASEQVRAAVKTSLGDLGIPVPLKAYPTPPSLVNQVAAGFPQQDGTVERARLWEYSFDYAYSGAAQDDVHVKVDIGSSSGINASALVEYPFESALLQFTQSWEALNADLDSYVRTPDFTGKGLAVIQSFAWLVQQLSDTWPQDQVVKNDALSIARSIEFSVLQNSVDTDKQKGVLEVTVNDPADAAIPAIEIDGYTLQQQTPGIYRYKDPGSDFYLPYEAALHITQRKVDLIGATPSPAAAFDILAENSAWGSLYVARNERYGARPGNPDFIYRTPYVRHVTPAVPLLNPAIEIPMQQYSTGTLPLVTYLTNFTAALLTPQGSATPVARTLQIGCLYRYFVDEARQLPVEVPVALSVPATILPSSPVLQSLADSVQGFLANSSLHPQQGDGSQFVFTYSLFDDALSTTLPLLKLDRITLPAYLAAPAKEKNQ